jgi:osmotically-inducible protein OsmY
MPTPNSPDPGFVPPVGSHDAVADVRRRIAEAFQRVGDIDARRIRVGVDGDRATLTGTVTTSLQRWAAEYAALDTPGIAQVDNRIVVWPKEKTLVRPESPGA